MGLVTWDRAHFKHDEPSRVDARLEAEKIEDTNKRSVYAFVSTREEYRCRVCDTYCDPRSATLLKKGHHHHIVYESACGPTTVENVCLLCAKCHSDEHRHRIAIEGNADAAPWLTLSRRHHETGAWFVWKQEIGIRLYERD